MKNFFLLSSSMNKTLMFRLSTRFANSINLALISIPIRFARRSTLQEMFAILNTSLMSMLTQLLFSGRLKLFILAMQRRVNASFESTLLFNDCIFCHSLSVTQMPPDSNNGSFAFFVAIVSIASVQYGLFIEYFG